MKIEDRGRCGLDRLFRYLPAAPASSMRHRRREPVITTASLLASLLSPVLLFTGTIGAGAIGKKQSAQKHHKRKAGTGCRPFLNNPIEGVFRTLGAPPALGANLISSISEAWTGLAKSEEYTALHVFLPYHALNPRRATLRGRKNRDFER
jgi:hypothetical protein